uniref:Uncharacterized protein n=1 Tax=Lepeophtheirus salmonis TaxID=72036 RepID=A0A0K2UPX0_LEPSM
MPISIRPSSMRTPMLIEATRVKINCKTKYYIGNMAREVGVYREPMRSAVREEFSRDTTAS